MNASKNLRTVLLTAILLTISSSNLFASEKPNDTNTVQTKSWDKFSVSLGGFVANYKSTLTLGSKHLGAGLVLNLENALDLRVTAWAFRTKLQYRFGKKNKSAITAGYFQVYRTSSKRLGADLEIGDVIIPIGTDIISKFNFSIVRAKYDYSFYQDNRVSLGASVGFFVMPISFSVLVEDESATSTDMLAPLPVVGLRSDFLITPKFFYRQSIELLYLEYDGLSGGITDLDLSLEYRPIKNFGCGLGVNTTKLDLTSEDSDYPGLQFYGQLASSYTGIYLFGKFVL